MTEHPLDTGAQARWPILISPFLFALMALAAELALAATEPGPGLTLVRPDGTAVATPALQTEYRLTVNGLVGRAALTQTYVNDTEDWVEARYLYPLPPNAAVDRLELRIDERRIVGEIQPKETARETFEAARDAGQVAGLVDQHRPNAFTTRVANVPPGARLSARIGFTVDVAFEDGRFRLRLPLVTPVRFHDTAPLLAMDETGDWHIGLAPVAPEAAELDQPRTVGAPINPVTLHVAIDAGLPVETVGSPTHKVDVTMTEGHRFAVALAGPAHADRDFVLDWAPAPSDAPQLAAFTETKDGTQYGYVMVVPPPGAPGPVPARELVFVLDRSGSMHGASLAQAKTAMVRAIDALRPDDRFTVLVFDDRHQALFPGLVQATREMKRAALVALDQVTSGGGTVLDTPLYAALALPRDNHEAVRQVVLITDGAISAESDVIEGVGARLGDARLYPVGVGSAPNGYLIDALAQAGRGSALTIPLDADIADEMDRLLARLAAPVMTDLSLSLNGGAAQPLADLHAGQPVIATVAAPLGPDAATVTIAGRRLDAPWQTEVALSGPTADGVAQLWARDRIGGLEAARLRGGDADALDAEILSLSLAHGMVGRLTSLVAVERTPIRPAGEDLASHDMPANLPHGWSREAVLGLPQTATPAPLLILIGAGLLLIAGGWHLAGRRHA